MKEFVATGKNGEPGHRSQCLSHAKRALYHLSYIPVCRRGIEPLLSAWKAAMLPLTSAALLAYMYPDGDSNSDTAA